MKSTHDQSVPLPIVNLGVHDVEELPPTYDARDPHLPQPQVPDGGYGWVVAFCLMVMNAVTWGKNTPVILVC